MQRKYQYISADVAHWAHGVNLQMKTITAINKVYLHDSTKDLVAFDSHGIAACTHYNSSVCVS